jgi:hypothetical protein
MLCAGRQSWLERKQQVTRATQRKSHGLFRAAWPRTWSCTNHLRLLAPAGTVQAVSSSSWARDETALASSTLLSAMTANDAHAHTSNFLHGAPAKVDSIEVELAPCSLT